jgi:hypothetical protein
LDAEKTIMRDRHQNKKETYSFFNIIAIAANGERE